MLDLDRWSLQIEGDAVVRPTRLSFAEILRLPQRRLTAYLECAGNQRATFDLLQGRRARLVGEQIDYGWAQFEIEWQGEVGEHAIMTRATDRAGNTQPELTPFNEKGYLFNQPLPHPIIVG